MVPLASSSCLPSNLCFSFCSSSCSTSFWRISPSSFVERAVKVVVASFFSISSFLILLLKVLGNDSSVFKSSSSSFNYCSVSANRLLSLAVDLGEYSLSITKTQIWSRRSCRIQFWRRFDLNGRII